MMNRTLLRRSAFSSPGILGLGLVFLALMLVTKPNQGKKYEEEVLQVKSVVGSSQNASPSKDLLGVVTNPSYITLKSDVTAKVQEVFVREGDQVQLDQILILFDAREAELGVTRWLGQTADLQAQITSLQLRQTELAENLKRQKALVLLARRKALKVRELLDQNLISQDVYEDRRSSLIVQEKALSTLSARKAMLPLEQKSLEAKLMSAKSQLEQAQLILSKHEVRAPFGGLVASVAVSAGDGAVPQTGLINLFDPAQTEVTSSVPLDEAIEIRRWLNEGYRFEGTIIRSGIALELDRLAVEIKPGSGSVNAFFRFPQNTSLELGRNVSVRLKMPVINDVILLPADSLYNGHQLFVIEDNRLQSVGVEVLGRRRDEDGLKLLIKNTETLDGKQILVSRLSQAVSGVKVASDYQVAMDNSQR